MNTYNDELHEYKIDGVVVPGQSKIMEDLGVTDFSRVHPGILENAQDFGKEVHRVCQLYDLDNLIMDSVDPYIMPCLNGWIKFLKDHNPEMIHIEKPLYSKKYMIAGTPDRLWIIKNEGIGDIKTCTTINHKTTAIQTGIYDMLAAEDLGFKSKRNMCIHLPGNNDYNLHEYDRVRSKRAGLDLVHAYHIKHSKKTYLKGA